MGDGARLKQLESVVLKGSSTELPQVYAFTAALNGVAPFRTVEATRVTKRTTDEGDLTDFEVRCVLLSAVEAAL